ncbi:Plasmodium exported protein (PHISTa-like), unknown function [Plasmodium sp. gorilla clade G2]|uniref:Plasmodium exported protein (PHISTa-like), unknown function n=1 Tax=Plasmodium sp. gorilla clade G2 TaxID=880535 RepID=UPI000D200F3F|nr:Plasmodium exported protein (PHISTa-like), unknown function [Plasmodium sp. gorilla clade G2]SOV16411.1 Plasmodium exported protein (PHISTa-like), unknown function [Plasmodium sp. gorilla clade G2]
MAIIYTCNLKEDQYNPYSTDLNRERMECRIPRRSILFISLSLCVISLFYISLLDVFHENVIQRTKYNVIISRNLSQSENKNKNVQRKNVKKLLEEMHESSINSKNNKGITSENKDNNDVSKKLKEKELYDILNSLKECPPKDDLNNIWNHAMGVVKEDFDNVLYDLETSIQEYLDSDYSYSYCCVKFKPVYASILEENIARFNGTFEKELKKYTDKFFSLIKGKPTLDDILKFIYSFLEHFRTLKKELHKKHKKELLRKVEEPWNG